jgi:hypothetical protein
VDADDEHLRSRKKRRDAIGLGKVFALADVTLELAAGATSVAEAAAAYLLRGSRSLRATCLARPVLRLLRNPEVHRSTFCTGSNGPRYADEDRRADVPAIEGVVLLGPSEPDEPSGFARVKHVRLRPPTLAGGDEDREET